MGFFGEIKIVMWGEDIDFVVLKGLYFLFMVVKCDIRINRIVGMSVLIIKIIVVLYYFLCLIVGNCYVDYLIGF